MFLWNRFNSTNNTEALNLKLNGNQLTLKVFSLNNTCNLTRFNEKIGYLSSYSITKHIKIREYVGFRIAMTKQIDPKAWVTAKCNRMSTKEYYTI